MLIVSCFHQNNDMYKSTAILSYILRKTETKPCIYLSIRNKHLFKGLTSHIYRGTFWVEKLNGTQEMQEV